MELSNELKEKLEDEISNLSINELKDSAKKISLRYRNGEKNKTSIRLIQNQNEALAYALSRMPATYGAIYSALEHTFEVLKMNDIDYKYLIKSLVDIGAGTGTATWAAVELLDLENIICLENETNMLLLGEKLMQGNINAKWNKIDVIVEELKEKADLVIAAYMLNEIKEENLNKVLEKLWNATNNLLLIVEPGTPDSYKKMMKIRKFFIENKLEVVAPCPHLKECKISSNDWCSFSCRISRSKIHKLLKGGDAPYEDEKFCYLAVYKEAIKNKENRILRHPKIENGLVRLKICNKNSDINEITITKKNKELFKKTRKMRIGDIFKN